MGSPKWLADEMLGRLARYLRFLGHDTRYAQGLTDAEIVELARLEGRTLLTRDRQLSRKVSGALLLTSVSVKDQLRSVARAFPAADYEVRFDRCTLCNGTLEPAAAIRTVGLSPTNGIRELPARDRAVFVCSQCGHKFWEGSHTAEVRARIRSWLGEGR